MTKGLIDMEFRRMRRSAQELSLKEAETILENGSHGVLAVSGDGGYPYAVPMSYVYSDGKIYLHSAAEGHRIDAVKRSDKVSFCVVAEDSVLPEKFTTLYKSTVAFGRARILCGEEALSAMRLLAEKYCPNESEKSLENEINSSFGRFSAIEIAVEHLSAKAARELILKEGKS